MKSLKSLLYSFCLINVAFVEPVLADGSMLVGGNCCYFMPSDNRSIPGICRIFPFGFDVSASSWQDCDDYCMGYMEPKKLCPGISITSEHREGLASPSFCTRQRETVHLFNYLCDTLRVTKLWWPSVDRAIKDAIAAEKAEGNNPEVLWRLDALYDGLGPCIEHPPVKVAPPCDRVAGEKSTDESVETQPGAPATEDKFAPEQELPSTEWFRPVFD